MLIALIIGAITGWLLAMPIGPVNATAIGQTLKHGYKSGFAVGIGAALMDIIYCAGSAQINQFLVESPVINLIFEIIGFIVLVWLGIRQLKGSPLAEAKKHEQHDDGTRGDRVAEAAIKRMHIGQRSLFSPFILGAALYATNVLAVPEWIIIAGLWRSWGLLGVGFGTNAVFAAGAGLGTAAWYVVIIRWITRRNRSFKQDTLKKIDFGIGIAMLVFGCYFLYEIVFGTHWEDVKSHVKANTSEYIHV